MIDQEKRRAIFTLHQEGIKVREISRKLRVSRNTVRSIIKQRGAVPDCARKDKIEIDPELLSRLYGECSGRIQRIHEKLTEEEGIHIGYSTLSRIIRELGLGESKKDRCCHVPDEPGVEMQHDTTVYTLRVGMKKLRVVASLLYFRYSKMRYLKFYRSFNRFKMKCFFHEALSYFGYSAPVCIIDNTNLARLRGTGKNAIIVPEMEEFARGFGFQFLCHEKGHANRKAGNERSFYTIETNFFPGRSFETLEDLNTQACKWATLRMANRPVSKTNLIPARAFEYEKLYLVKLPPYISPPYLVFKRDVDQYGYTSFDGNFYWVPGISMAEVLVLQYGSYIRIYRSRKQLAEYPLPAYGVKNEVFSPQGMPKPRCKPNNRKHPTAQEEKRLRSLSGEVDAYLDFVLTHKGKEKHRFIRQVFGLYQKLTPELFIKTIKRALKYRVMDMKTIERIAILQITDADIEIPQVEIDEQFRKREAYLEGRLSDEVDLSIYEKMLEDTDE